MRIFRGREQFLSEDAVRWLVDAILAAAATDVLGSRGLAIAVEVALTRHSELRAELMTAVTEWLARGEPEAVAWLAYVLLGRGWKTP
jgi:uncharacterized protein YggL (DUF469 family)